MTQKTEIIGFGILVLALLIMFPLELKRLVETKLSLFITFSVLLLASIFMWIKFGNKNY